MSKANFSHATRLFVSRHVLKHLQAFLPRDDYVFAFVFADPREAAAIFVMLEFVNRVVLQRPSDSSPICTSQSQSTVVLNNAVEIRLRPYHHILQMRTSRALALSAYSGEGSLRTSTFGTGKGANYL